MPDTNPFRELGKRYFIESFGDLLGARAYMTYFYQSIIEGTYEILLVEKFGEHDALGWEQTTRAAFSMLDKGALRSTEFVSDVFMKNINEVIPALVRCWDKRKEIKNMKSSEVDIYVENNLSLYKIIYERLLPIIMAPVVAAFGKAHGASNKIFTPRQDGKISLKSIDRMEEWIRPPQNRLAIGLNHHIRNAYSHENFRLLDGGSVELWDIDPRRPRKNWGPEIWSSEKVYSLCEQLFFNSLGVIIGLVIFGINNQKTIEDRGWYRIEDAPIRRFEDLRHLVKSYAKQIGFRLDKLTVDQNILTSYLSTKCRGIDQEQDIFVGGKSGVTSYKLPVRHEEVSVAEQCVNLMQFLAKQVGGIDKYQIFVKGPEGSDLGQLVASLDLIKSFPGPSTLPFADARKKLEADTLGDATMYMETKGALYVQ